jgi:glycine/D-amino acid oxidase-like deaminating enzyme
VRAQKIVFATGYETPEFFPRDICALKSTYALAAEPVTDLHGWRDRSLIWESGNPYFYARCTRDGRPMMGGEDEDFADPAARDALIPAKAVALTTKFAALFPSIDLKPTCAWAGTFAETKDGLPFIGAARQFLRGYFALGYGGNGIVFGLIAARIICDLFLGRQNRDAALFGFDR